MDSNYWFDAKSNGFTFFIIFHFEWNNLTFEKRFRLHVNREKRCIDILIVIHIKIVRKIFHQIKWQHWIIIVEEMNLPTNDFTRQLIARCDAVTADRVYQHHCLCFASDEIRRKESRPWASPLNEKKKITMQPNYRCHIFPSDFGFGFSLHVRLFHPLLQCATIMSALRPAISCAT